MATATAHKGVHMIVTLDENHQYTLDGLPAPGVSEILGATGLKDTFEFGTDDARLRGTRLHAATWLDDQGKLDEKHFAERFPDLMPRLRGWRKFLRDSGILVVDGERSLGNKSLGYCGTPDRDAKFADGTPVILDIKTGAKMWWHRYQTAGYFGLYDEPRERFSVYISESGTVRLEPHGDINDWTVFKSAVTVYHARIQEERR